MTKTWISILLVATIGISAAIEYQSGSTVVNVVTEYIDENNSTQTCVTYKKGNIPEKYDMACFTTKYTPLGTFIGCDVLFGTEYCNSCAPCETNDELIAFTIDCFNTQPDENTFACVELTDRNVQEVLVDKAFQQDFDFSVETEDDPPATPSIKPTGNGESRASVVGLSVAVVGALFVAAM